MNNKVEEGKTDLENKPSLEATDIVGAVFAHSGLDSFPFNTIFLNGFFQKAKESRRYSELLKEFLPSPLDVDNLYSHGVGLILTRLVWEGSLKWVAINEMKNLGQIKMSEKARKEKIENVLKLNPSKKTQKLLKELGVKFKEEVEKLYPKEKK